MKKWTSFLAAVIIVFIALVGWYSTSLGKELNSPKNVQQADTSNQTQPIESAEQDSNENVSFTSLEKLIEIYAVNWNSYVGGAQGAGIVISNPELHKLVDAPVNITKEGIDSLTLADRKLYLKVLANYVDITSMELGLLTDSDGIKFELNSLPGYWLVTPEEHAGYYWPKDDRWGPEPFTVDTPKK